MDEQPQFAIGSLYLELAEPAPPGAMGRTAGDATEGDGRQRRRVVAPRGARGSKLLLMDEKPRSVGSLYLELAEPVPAASERGKTTITATKETVDADREAVLLELLVSSSTIRAVVFAAEEDEHAAPVMAALATLGVAATQLDVALLERTKYCLTSAGLTFAAADRDVFIPANGSVRGWLRRLAPPQWRRDAAASSYEGAVRASWVALLVGITRSCRISWLTDLERVFVAENKLVQLAAAESLGIATPVTATVASREQIPAALGERFVAKPLGPGQFDDPQGRPQAVFTRELTREARELDTLGGAPFLLQQLLAADRHLRVVTVAERSWVCALEAQELPLDWRREDSAHDAFVSSDEYGEVGEQSLALTRALGVGYSSQDWVVARGQGYFLDLNPGGQWLFLPDSVSSEVTAAIAAWLAGPTS